MQESLTNLIYIHTHTLLIIVHAARYSDIEDACFFKMTSSITRIIVIKIWIKKSKTHVHTDYSNK